MKPAGGKTTKRGTISGLKGVACRGHGCRDPEAGGFEIMQWR